MYLFIFKDHKLGKQSICNRYIFPVVHFFPEQITPLLNEHFGRLFCLLSCYPITRCLGRQTYQVGVRPNSDIVRKHTCLLSNRE